MQSNNNDYLHGICFWEKFQALIIAISIVKERDVIRFLTRMQQWTFTSDDVTFYCGVHIWQEHKKNWAVGRILIGIKITGVRKQQQLRNS